MIVCVCNNVSEKDIENAVRDGAHSLNCLAEKLAVSTCCGQCACVADETLQQAVDRIARPIPLPLPVVQLQPELQFAAS